MLTRLEIDGFKNLVDFSLDFGPFTCIAGPNGVGKSNIFDAIRFLSLLSDHTIIDAARLCRGNDIENVNISDLFTKCDGKRVDRFKIAAEMIVSPDVVDDFGRPSIASSTHLRYEIEVTLEESTQRVTQVRPVLHSESLNYITQGQSAQRIPFPHSASNFRRAVVFNRRRGENYISTSITADGIREIKVHADGGSRGVGQTAPAATAPKTIVGTSNTSTTPTILAARREMQKWKFLALEPSSMRRPDRFYTDPYINANGGHIPATLNRIIEEAEENGTTKDDVLSEIVARISRLVPIRKIAIDADEVRQTFTLMAEESGGVSIPAFSLSDGTLRFLTLAVLASDPKSQDLICLEEPENGIHPAKINLILKLLKELSVDPDQQPGPDNPFRQIIIATHSPSFVQLQSKNDLVYAKEALVKTSNGTFRTLRCCALEGSWRVDSGIQKIGMASIVNYLAAPEGAQLQLPNID